MTPQEQGGAPVIRVTLPAHLRTLAQVHDEVRLEVAEPVTKGRVLEALERCYPVLEGAIRDRVTGERRAYVRFFADEQDLSHAPLDAELPPAVLAGREPFRVIGAIAGG